MNAGTVSYRIVRAEDNRMIGTVNLTVSGLAHAEHLHREGKTVTRASLKSAVDPLNLGNPHITYWSGRETEIDDTTPLVIEVPAS